MCLMLGVGRSKCHCRLSFMYFTDPPLFVTALDPGGVQQAGHFSRAEL